MSNYDLFLLYSRSPLAPAAPAPNGDFLEVTPEMWRDSIDTALIGPIEIMRNYIPVMKKKG